MEMIPITAPRYGCGGQTLRHPKLLGMEPRFYPTSETIKVSDQDIRDAGYTYTGGTTTRSRSRSEIIDTTYEDLFTWIVAILFVLVLVLIIIGIARKLFSQNEQAPPPPASPAPASTLLSTEITKVISGLTPTGGTVKVSSKGGDNWEVTIPTPAQGNGDEKK